MIFPFSPFPVYVSVGSIFRIGFHGVTLGRKTDPPLMASLEIDPISLSLHRCLPLRFLRPRILRPRPVIQVLTRQKIYFWLNLA